MPEIIRTANGSTYGVLTKTVSGLYMFASNRVAVPTDQDPRIVFLRAIARQKQSLGHIGTITLNDICGGYEATHTFMATKLETDEFISTRYGVDEGTFYTFRDEDVPGGFVVPSVNERFWQLGFLEEEADDMEYVIRRGSVALYVDPLPQSSLSLLLAPDIPTDPKGYGIEMPVWMERVLRNFQTAIVVGHDGVTLDAYAKNFDDLAYLEIGVREAEQSIRQNAWFQANTDQLIWDDFDECLKFPKS